MMMSATVLGLPHHSPKPSVRWARSHAGGVSGGRRVRAHRSSSVVRARARGFAGSCPSPRVCRIGGPRLPSRLIKPSVRLAPTPGVFRAGVACAHTDRRRSCARARAVLPARVRPHEFALLRSEHVWPLSPPMLTSLLAFLRRRLSRVRGPRLRSSPAAEVVFAAADGLLLTDNSASFHHVVIVFLPHCPTLFGW
jgi:hypothetical protein